MMDVGMSFTNIFFGGWVYLLPFVNYSPVIEYFITF